MCLQAKISTSEQEVKALTDRLEASERLNEQLVARNRDLEITAHLASQAPHALVGATPSSHSDEHSFCENCKLELCGPYDMPHRYCKQWPAQRGPRKAKGCMQGGEGISRQKDAHAVLARMCSQVLVEAVLQESVHTFTACD